MGWNHLIAITKGPIINMHMKGCKQIFCVKTMKIFVFLVEATILFLADATKCLGTAFNFPGT